MGIRKGQGKVYGVGVNDGMSTFFVNTEGKRVKCAIYAKWSDMIRRCYNKSDLIKDPCYEIVTVCEEWKIYSNFYNWISKEVSTHHPELEEDQKWRSLNLDKDLLFSGNNQYHPSRCLLVDNRVNKLILIKERSRGKFPLGVSVQRQGFAANCCVDSTPKYLGEFNNPFSAHRAWQKCKYEGLEKFSKDCKDSRISEALIRISLNIKFDFDNNLETKEL